MEAPVGLRFGSIPGKNTINGEWTGPNALWYIEEKVDGSQLSFEKKGGTFFFANRGTLLKDPPGWLFSGAVAMISTLDIPEGYTFHGECVAKVKHNVCRYERVPKYQFILFGINTQGGDMLGREDMEDMAGRIGLECVQLFWRNRDESVQPASKVAEILDGITAGTIKSMLGGDPPEGMVFKHNARLKNKSKKTVATMMKIVRKEFKEKHANGGGADWREKTVLTHDERLAYIMSHYSREARWQKAIQRLRDRGEITGEPENAVKERNKIMTEARIDFEREEAKHLREMLWAMFGQTLVQSITDGMGEKYKNDECP